MAMAKKQAGSSGKGGKPRLTPHVYLTEEQQRLLIGAVEAGGTLDAAARAAGMSPRKLRELRQRANGDHPTRAPLPHLKPFFEDLGQAIGRRLLANEIWLSEHDPKAALKYLRASLIAAGEDDEPLRLPTADELQEQLDVLISSGAFRSPPCGEASCPCRYHHGERRTST